MSSPRSCRSRPEPPADSAVLQSAGDGGAAPDSSGSEIASSVAKPPKRRPARPPRVGGYETAESGDELEEDDFENGETVLRFLWPVAWREWPEMYSPVGRTAVCAYKPQKSLCFSSEFPPIRDEEERQDYKREFDREHHEYKSLQAEMDEVNGKLSELDRRLDDLEEDSPEFLDAVDEYNRLKDVKRSADYQSKKRRCKYLKAKLSHIKKMVGNFDRRA
ncbi:hypothetical protein Z043_119214 [Scleropages formosus]|uniref:OCEL domain-containing protein n=1 Tax=Scleropages formosus TaxID=113540 RepID=A0A0P7UT41_SCLFO|nr:hypothetical protein Z043_119214 [Scleropages formosus]